MKFRNCITRGLGGKSPKSKVAAVAVVLVLLLSASATAIAATFPRTVGLQLTASSETVEPDGSVTLTVSSVNPQGFKKGFAGLTMDIYYNSNVMVYDEETGISSELDGAQFKVAANEYESGKVAVLIYADGLDSDDMLFAAGAGELFSLPFKVEDGVTSGDCEFSIPDGYKLADYNDEGTGFTYANVSSAPSPVTVTVEDLSTSSYTISIPSGVKNITGAGSTLLGSISLVEGSTLSENGLIITAVASDESKLIKTGDATKNIPFSLTSSDSEQTSFAGVTFTNGGANATENIYAFVTENDWNAAEAGSYTGNITFTVAENS